MAFYAQVMAMREATVKATHGFDFITRPVRFLRLRPNTVARTTTRNAHSSNRVTVPYNMSEQPAASINWSYSTQKRTVGLPIGVRSPGVASMISAYCSCRGYRADPPDAATLASPYRMTDPRRILAVP